MPNSEYASDPSNEEREKPVNSPWAKVFWLIVVLIFAALVVFGSFIWITKHGIDSSKEIARDIIEVFNPEEVVETFAEYREMTAKGTKGNILEVATGTATEVFTRKTSLQLFGATLPLGTTVSEISVPATYRYHIDLLGDWFVTSDGSRLLVIAPPIRPSLPVAFDTAGVQKRTDTGWARWDGDENMAELEKSLTGQLEERAGSEESLNKAREKSRAAVAKFLQTWLINQKSWGDTQFSEITVRFADEKSETPLSGQEATVKL